MAEVKRLFVVDGKPFFPIGAEFLCQSGYSARDEDEIEEAFKALKTAHGNTGEFPVFWDQVEPEEGKFDFSSVDTLISIACKYGDVNPLDIVAANHLVSLYTLTVGQSLSIP